MCGSQCQRRDRICFRVFVGSTVVLEHFHDLSQACAHHVCVCCVNAVLQEVEQRLLLECGRCPYQRSLVLTATALVQPDATRQQALLEVCAA
jgi:hypothetical protein